MAKEKTALPITKKPQGTQQTTLTDWLCEQEGDVIVCNIKVSISNAYS